MTLGGIVTALGLGTMTMQNCDHDSPHFFLEQNGSRHDASKRIRWPIDGLMVRRWWNDVFIVTGIKLYNRLAPDSVPHTLQHNNGSNTHATHDIFDIEWNVQTTNILTTTPTTIDPCQWYPIEYNNGWAWTNKSTHISGTFRSFWYRLSWSYEQWYVVLRVKFANGGQLLDKVFNLCSRYFLL